jgi:hypothetical protein
MAEFPINGNEYRTNKLDAVKQFHVARRIAPVLTTSVDLIQIFEKIDLANIENVEPEEIMKAISPLVSAIGALPDEDAEYIINTCLRITQRKGPTGQWGPVMAQHGGGLMFDDIEMEHMLQIVWAVVQDNLARFLGALPSTSKGGAAVGQA